jgi:hypothetical protein
MITRGIALDVTNEIKAAIDGIFARRGFASPTLKTTYGDNLYKLAIETTPDVRNESGINLKSKEALYYTRYGFTDYDGATPRKLTAPLGTWFVSKGENYTFAGIAASRSKYPIVGINLDTNETTFFTAAIVGRINDAASGE